jgi:hypothetical protein
MKEVLLDDVTRVGRLAELLDVPAARVVEAGFRRLGLLLTIHELIDFEIARVIAAGFGYRARLR